MVVRVILVRKHQIVIRLTGGTALRHAGTRMNDHIVLAVLAVAKEVLAAAPHHEVMRVVHELRSVVVIDRPDACIRHQQTLALGRPNQLLNNLCDMSLGHRMEMAGWRTVVAVDPAITMAQSLRTLPTKSQETTRLLCELTRSSA